MSSGNLDIIQIMLEASIVVKFILLILIVLSIISWGIIFLKFGFIKNMKTNNEEFLSIYNKINDLNEIGEHAKDLGESGLKNVYLEGLKELKRLRNKFEGELLVTYLKEFGTKSIERSLGIGVNNTNLLMDKYLSILASISSVAPFVGLLGTVIGIINSFNGLASGGGSSLDSVAPGIAEALVATAIGLAAAIPANWFYNYFSTINEEINIEMDSFNQEYVNLLEKTIL